MEGWGGVGVFTFLALAHIVDAMAMFTFLALAHMVVATARLGFGVGLGGDVHVPCACKHGRCYGDVHVPCTCTHGRCYGTLGVWGGVGMFTFLALALTLRLKDADTGQVNEEILDWVFCYAWRKNARACGKDLGQSLAKVLWQD